MITLNPDSGTPREYEITFAIISHEPERVRCEIAELSTVGGHRVLPPELLMIHDVYLDTPEGDLRKKSWALRIRSCSGTVKFALKGPAIKTAGGMIERPELEDAWSHEAPERIRSALAVQNIRLALRRSPGLDMPPVETLMHSGFRVIQTRETRRELKSIVSRERRLEFADLALDTVSYYFDTTKIRHAEIEIEAKGPDAIAATKAVSDYLMAAYSSELRRWDYGKLATGLALEGLLRRGSLEGLIRADRYLQPSVYDRLTDRLSQMEPVTGM